jgi:hypothetical protein
MLVAQCVALVQLNALACKRTDPSGAEAASSIPRSAAPDATRVRVFLEDCEFAGWSMIKGGMFLHLRTPDAPRGDIDNPVVAVRVLGDGRIDFAASTPGARVYGEWPGAARLQTLTDASTGIYEFSRWSGSAWTKDPMITPSVMSLVAWHDGTMLRVERHSPHGTRLAVQNAKPGSAPLRTPPEIERLDAAAIVALPETGIVVMTGDVDGEGSYAIVAGTTTAALRNSVGSSEVAASSSCDRILLSQWVDARTGDPAPRARAVRIREGRIELGEDLPAEPAHFAIDRRCHEWLVSSQGALFERESPARGWQKIDVAPVGNEPRSTAIAALGDRVWVSMGPTLHVVHAGKSERVELPFSLGPNGAAFFLGADEHADRMWAAVIPTNEKRGTILTTGPAPQKMRCDDLAKRMRAGD